MSKLKTIRYLFIATLGILAFLDPDLITMADLLEPTEHSLLARTGTLVLLNLTGLLQYIMQILQKAERITRAAGYGRGQDLDLANHIKNGGDAFPFLHSVFQGMIERVGTLIVSVKGLDSPSLIWRLALQLQDATSQARRAVELGISFQWIARKAMAIVLGDRAAARLIAYANIILFLLQYRLARIILGLCVWSLHVLNI